MDNFKEPDIDKVTKDLYAEERHRYARFRIWRNALFGTVFMIFAGSVPLANFIRQMRLEDKFDKIHAENIENRIRVAELTRDIQQRETEIQNERDKRVALEERMNAALISRDIQIAELHAAIVAKDERIIILEKQLTDLLKLREEARLIDAKADSNSKK